MATQHNLYTINTTAVQVSPSPTSGAGKDVTLQNVGSDYIYIGAAGVTTTNYGYRLAPHTAISFELDEQDELYAIGAVAGSLAVLVVNLENK